MFTLSSKEACRIALIAQGLHTNTPFGAGKPAVQRCIEQLGYIQIDTIAVIKRSHHHTFWTRVPSYKERHLDALQKERRILEYWSHAAAYLPMQDYRYCLPHMHAIATGQQHWRTPDRKTMKSVLERIAAEGPLMARDFEHSKNRGNEWGWNWKPAKIALEQLFIEGKLIVSHREGFQKVYNLPERVLPDGLDTSMPTDEEFQRYLILSTLRAHGLATEPEFSYLRKGMKAGMKIRLWDMLGAGEIARVRVGKLASPFYSTESILETLSGRRVAKNLHLLSPFDNAVIKRKRIQQLFDSSYQIECFVPERKRRFGYYCLPILYGTEIVGRLDPKADRRKGELIIKSLSLEQPVKDLNAFTTKLAAKLRQVAAFNGCENITWKPARTDRAGQLLAGALKV
jgi:hypothetical protein